MGVLDWLLLALIAGLLQPDSGSIRCGARIEGHGSTMIRVGTAIFGARNYQK